MNTHRVFIFTVFTLLIMSISADALAQRTKISRYNSIEDIQTNAYSSSPRFDGMVRRSLSMPNNFDFSDFRRKYTETYQYDPIGEKTLKKMNELAYYVQTEADKNKAKQYRKEYQALLVKHMANLGVVMQAASLSKRDKRFGDPKFFKWMKSGLIRDVLNSGDGYSLRGAYDVITMAEETIIFNYLDIKPRKTTSNTEGYMRYNMHDVVNLRDGEEYTIFVNTTFPVKFLEALAEMQESSSIDLGYQ